MTIPNDENPYRPTGNEVPGPSVGPEAEFKLTVVERVLMLLAGIIVAIPVFFTTCIGGGLGLFSLGVGSLHRGIPEEVAAVLWLVSFGLACWAGIVVARLVKRRRRRKAASGDSP